MVRGLPSAWRAGFADGPGDGVVGLGRGDDALGAGELDAGGKGVELLDGAGFDQAEVHDVRDQRGHAVVAQAAGVDAGRHEGAAQGVHLDQRGEVAGVAEVVGEAGPW